LTHLAGPRALLPLFSPADKRGWESILKEWVLIHHIKSLYADGDGQSIRAIAQQLGISRNTVRKYLRLNEEQIGARLDDPSRVKRLDHYREQIIHQLQQFPRLSAVKVLRKLRAQGVETTFSDRTVRRYIEELKKTVAVKQPRYYMPVLDMVPGVQCQVLVPV